MGGIASGIGSAVGGIAGAVASEHAANLQATAAQNALNQQQGMFNTQQANIAPYLQAGSGALGQLTAGTQAGGQFAQQPAFTYNPSQGLATTVQGSAPGLQTSLAPTGAALNALNPGQFAAPTADQAAATPGYQFTLGQGLQALQRNEAATGQLGGAAAKQAEQYGTGLASQTYQQSYNNALNAYQTNQQAAQQALSGQTGLFGTNLGAATGLYGTNLQGAGALQSQALTPYQTQQNALQSAYNRIAGIAGMGQGAVSQSGQAAQNYGNQAANLLTSQGAAQSAGTMGVANSLTAGAMGLGNALTNQYYAQQYGGGGYGGGGIGPYGSGAAALQSFNAANPAANIPESPNMIPTFGAV